MNKLIKLGLILQIPNALILTIFLIGFIVINISLYNFGWILLGSILGLINIFSFIFLICGVFKNER